ncbi:MAG: hypothetical protein ACTHK4_09060 [Mycobacteriales bacterium]
MPRRLVPVVALVLATSWMLAEPSSATGVPAPHVSATPGYGGALYDGLTPVAGDADTLVYVRQQSLARDGQAARGTAYLSASGPPQLVARSAAGAESTFGTLPQNDFGFDNALVHSLYGGVFLTTGANRDVDNSFPGSNVAHLWRTSSGQSLTVTLPADDDVLAAGPNGFVYSLPDGAVKLRTFAGTVTALGSPFGSQHQALYGASNATGIEVSDGQGRSAYIEFAAPHSTTTLAGDSTAGAALECVAASALAAACYEYTLDDVYAGHAPSTYVLEPLDGSAATVASGFPNDYVENCGIGVAGDTLLASCGHFFSEPAGSTTASESSMATGYYSMASAFGEGVAPANDGLYAGTSADDVTELVPARRSPVSVDTFALTPRSLVYVDDQVVTSRGGAPESALTRAVGLRQGRVHLGHAHLLSTDTTPLDGSIVAASPSVSVYATGSADTGAVDLHISGRHPAVRAARPYDVQIQGDRVLYLSPDASSTDFRIYDAGTGRTRVGFRHQGGGVFSAALDGRYLVYSVSSGAVFRKNLSTGAVMQLAPRFPKSHGQNLGEQVFASGKWVGWDIAKDSFGLQQDAFLVDAGDHGRAIKLRHPLYWLGAAGAVIATTVKPRPANTYWLRSYSGRVRVLLPKAHYVAGPQIAGGMVAWASPSGALDVAPLPH